MQDQDQLIAEVGTSNPSEEVRQRWRAKAMASTFFMGKAVVGFKDLDPDLHGAMATWIQNGAKRKLGLAPRDHLKTSVWTIADSLRRVVCNPNIRILIVNETQTNAVHFLTKIKSVPERRALFRWLFPEVIPDFNNVRWSQTEIEFNRNEDYPEATVEVIGAGGASTSRHYNVIKEDDLVGKEASESPPVMEKAIEQHKLSESLLNSPVDEIQTYGTRWGVYDLARWIYDHEHDIDHFCLSIFRPDGTPIWPKRFSQDYIQALRIKYGPAMFALQYLNNAIADGVTEFRAEWLRMWHWSGDTIVLERPTSEGGPLRVKPEDLERGQVVDPCHSPESGDARAADLVWGLTRTTPFNIVVLHAHTKKITPKVQIEEAYAAHKKWNTDVVGLETVGAQLTFFYWIPTLYPTMPIRRLKTDTHTRKQSRIRPMGTYGEQGRLYIHRDMVDFAEEWCAFPNGRTVDLLDCFGYAPQVWNIPDEDTSGVVLDEDDENEEVDNGANVLTGY